MYELVAPVLLLRKIAMKYLQSYLSQRLLRPDKGELQIYAINKLEVYCKQYGKLRSMESANLCMILITKHSISMSPSLHTIYTLLS